MKQFLLTLIAALISLAASAQKEQDFAARFMELHGSEAQLSCTTVSPLMLERMMQLPDVEGNDPMKQVLAQLKSIRMVTGGEADKADQLYAQAQQLAQHNAQRYRLHTEEPGKTLYIRKRGRVIVEMVLLVKMEKNFSLINLTGNMTDQFLRQVLQI